MHGRTRLVELSVEVGYRRSWVHAVLFGDESDERLRLTLAWSAAGKVDSFSQANRRSARDDVLGQTVERIEAVVARQPRVGSRGQCPSCSEIEVGPLLVLVTDSHYSTS